MKGAKAKAWKWFSLYRRLKCCIETTGTSDWCICVTCKRRVQNIDGQLHAGHAIAGRNNTILLNEELVWGQCSGCNITGQYHLYSLFMIEKFGLKHWEELCFIARKGSPMKEWQWKEEADKWKSKFEGLRSLGL